VVLIVIYILLGVFLCSYEHYPIDDDWSYIKAAETFHHTGEMRFTSWTAMSLVFQVWWGTCFTKLFGFSIGVLRLSTLAISLLGLIFLYLLLRELDYDWRTSFLAVLLILFNPFSFPLNFTFFTDQFFISLLLASTYFYYKACKDKKDSYLLIASLIASCSVLVRQNGILVPVAVFIYLMVRERSSPGILKRSFLTLLIPFTALVAFTYWLNVIQGPPAEYLKQVGNILDTLRKPHLLAIKVAWRPLLILEFMGFCLLPMGFSFFPRIKEFFERRDYSHLLLLCLTGTLFYLFFEHLGIYSTTDLWSNGFRYAYISEYGYRDALNVFFFFHRTVDFLSVLAISYLIYLLIKYRKSIKERFTSSLPSLLILLIGVFQFLFLLTTHYKFSRYYLILVPFFVILILEITRQIKLNRKVFVLLLSFYAAFSFVVTQDVMSWNQAKWQTAQRLLDKAIAPRKISAGFAWDAWQSYQYASEHPLEIATQKGDIPWWIEELLPVIDPRYLISNSPVPTGFKHFTYFGDTRYNVIDSVDYFSLFYMRSIPVYVLERAPYARQQTAGFLSFDFLSNLKGARFRGGGALDEIKEVSVDVGEIKEAAWQQPVPSSISFRLKLPYGRCRLKTVLGVVPSYRDESGGGVRCKILIDDTLLENVFQKVGAIRVEQMRQFFRPRTFFFSKPRTYFLQLIDTQNDQDATNWQDLSLDLSAFAGKVIDITFEVSSVPQDEGDTGEVLWVHPTIESY